MMGSNELLDSDFATIPDLIAAHASERGEKVALVQDNWSLSYAELDRYMDLVATGLQRDLMGERRTVAILANTSVADTVVFLGALRAGCVPTLIAASATPDQVAGMLSDSDAPIAFVDASSERLAAQANIRLVRLDHLQSWLPGDSAKAVMPVLDPRDRFNIIYSSGTTGTPKGIVHTHRTRWTQAKAWSTSKFDNAVSLVATPLYSNTTVGCSLLPTLAYGGTIVLLGKFDARRYLEIAEYKRVTHTVLVPIQYQRIMAVPDFDRFDLNRFGLKIATGGPFPVKVKADVVKRWPGVLLEIYGMTEGGGTCTLLANDHPDKLHTVGQPAAGNDIRLIDEDGLEVADGEIGEVVGRSGVMMTGYHGRKEATGAAEWFDDCGNRFIRHGDLGRFDEDGFLTLLGRSKDMIISGGFNVYPTDIEAVLMQHPDMADAAVVGIPNTTWGESPYAFYVPAEGSAIGSDAIVAWVNERVGKTQRLVGAEPVAELPRGPLGKVLKRELRDRFEAASAS